MSRGLAGLPRSFWFLVLGMWINRLGAFVLPFLSLYLQERERLRPRRPRVERAERHGRVGPRGIERGVGAAFAQIEVALAERDRALDRGLVRMP